MPWQLIYTSAPRGLSSGQSGFCTVARSDGLREALAQRLEQLSYYHYLRVAEAATAGSNPTVRAFRILDLRGSKYYVLTRIQPCGLDFTARTNHLAHHLVFQSNELGLLPSPAAILRYWDKWCGAWQGDPRLLPDPSLDDFGSAAKYCLPANTWLRTTGDAGRAAGLLEGDWARGCYLVCPPGGEQVTLDLFCESLQLLNPGGHHPLRPWRHTFTTFLQAEDNPPDFQWRACQEETPGYQKAVKSAATLVPVASVRVPANSLVKVAREGHKAPTSVPPSAAAKPALELRPAEEKIPAASVAKAAAPAPEWIDPWGRKVAAKGKSSIPIGRVIGISIFVAVLAGLWAVKYAPWRKSSGSPASESRDSAPPIEPKPAPAASNLPHAVPETAPDAALLSPLDGEGPTYIIVTANLNSFTLPIESNLRLQKLINRFDKLATLPNNIQMSLNTDAWDFPGGAAMTINGRQGEAFTAQSAAGLELTLDYSNWKSDPHRPVLVHTSFPSPPRAFSIRFHFSTSEDGDPFRLLFINESEGPAPLHLSLRWLEGNRATLAASLRPPLYQLLSDNFRLPTECRWQLEPFVKTGPNQTRYLYKDWVAEDLPVPGTELDFAPVKRRLSARLAQLRAVGAAIAKKRQEQITKAGLDLPLGRDLELKEARLESFVTYAPDPSPENFIEYLNVLRKESKLKHWPHLASDDEEADLAAKFQRLQELLREQIPAEQKRLAAGGSNYFSGAWQNLKASEKVRQEDRRAQEDIDKLAGRLSLVPETLEKTAYASLFIVDPPRPGLEMIRFASP